LVSSPTCHSLLTDGIVIVYTHGNAPPMFAMYSDGHFVGQFATAYVTGTMPVRKGTTWQVNAIDQQMKMIPIPPDSMTIRWFPITLPTLSLNRTEKK
jgi:hypothetical protein